MFRSKSYKCFRTDETLSSSDQKKPALRKVNVSCTLLEALERRVNLHIFPFLALNSKTMLHLRVLHELYYLGSVLAALKIRLTFFPLGPDEDKVQGSILLPSYKISPVSKEDGVFRKFSFKAEHHNMRTYYFAADTMESMKQWMNALSLASILESRCAYNNYVHRKTELLRHHVALLTSLSCSRKLKLLRGYLVSGR